MIGYRRTVVVLWPERNTEKFIDDAPRTLRKLASTSNPTPAQHELDQVEYLFSAFQGGRLTPQALTRCICRVACMRKDPALWIRAVETCGMVDDLDVVGSDAMKEAVVAFGFSNVQAM